MLYRTLHRFPLFDESGEIPVVHPLIFGTFYQEKVRKPAGFQLRQFVVLHGVELLNGATYLHLGVDGPPIMVVNVGKRIFIVSIVEVI